MFDPQQPVFYFVTLASIFFVLLIAIIIITALLYHSRKALHKSEVANFQNVLHQAQLEAREQALQTLGSELHDNIGQLLSLTALTLGSVELNEQEKAEQKIVSAIDLTNRSIIELRQLGRLIQGEKLLETGLIDAIGQVLAWVEKSGHFQIVADLPTELPLTNRPEKDLILFRVLQETLNNIIKHAKASEIQVRLLYETGTLRLKIGDNGSGFDPGRRSNGMGLFNIYKRVETLGGQCDLRSAPDEGSSLTITIPYV